MSDWRERFVRRNVLRSEQDLFDYHEIKEGQAIDRATIMQETGGDGYPLAMRSDDRNPSNPTLSKVFRLAAVSNYLHYQQTNRLLTTIEKVYDTVSPEAQELIRRRYWENEPAPMTIARMHMGRSTYYEKRKDIICYLALKLGRISSVDAEKVKSGEYSLKPDPYSEPSNQGDVSEG